MVFFVIHVLHSLELILERGEQENNTRVIRSLCLLLILLVHSSLEGPGDRSAGKEGLKGSSGKERGGARWREVAEKRNKTLGAEWIKAFQNGGQMWVKENFRGCCSMNLVVLMCCDFLPAGSV